MALAQGVLQVVLDAAEDQKVRRIRLQIGRLRMIVPESLEFSFELIAEETPAAAAALEMEETPARLQCGQCGAESQLDLPPFNCRYCGASEIEVIAGDEIIVDVIELENGKTIKRQVPVGAILERNVEEQHAAYDGAYDD